MFWSILLVCVSGAIFTWGLSSLFSDVHKKIDELRDKVDRLERRN
jgi:hypothetical protein